MVKIFTKNGFREEVYGCGFQVKASRPFVDKHGKKQIDGVYDVVGSIISSSACQLSEAFA